MTDSIIFIFGIIVSIVFAAGAYTYLRIKFEHLAQDDLTTPKAKTNAVVTPIHPSTPKLV